MPLALLLSTHAAVGLSTTQALLVLEWVRWHMVYLQEQALAVVPTGHLLSHPTETQSQGREGQTPLLERHPSQQPKQTKTNPMPQRFPGYREGRKRQLLNRNLREACQHHHKRCCLSLLPRLPVL